MALFPLESKYISEWWRVALWKSIIKNSAQCLPPLLIYTPFFSLNLIFSARWDMDECVRWMCQIRILIYIPDKKEWSRVESQKVRWYWWCMELASRDQRRGKKRTDIFKFIFFSPSFTHFLVCGLHLVSSVPFKLLGNSSLCLKCHPIQYIKTYHNVLLCLGLFINFPFSDDKIHVPHGSNKDFYDWASGCY